MTSSSRCRWRTAAGYRWGVGIRDVVFASALGEGLFWVTQLFTVLDPNHQMPLVFGFRLLETVLDRFTDIVGKKDKKVEPGTFYSPLTASVNR